MTNYSLNRTYNEAMTQLQTTDKVHANTFNPLFNQLLNNDANHQDSINTLYSVYFSFSSTYAFSLNGLTVGKFTLPPFLVSLGTITLG